jgi:NAD(P)-dependent dehydrogenase (short-subunit alcohol dehydrogenase family)
MTGTKARGYEFDLTGKQAMIAGATGGIGRAIAEAYARYGANLALCGRKKGALDAEAKRLTREYGIRASGYILDVTDTAGISAVVDAVDADFGGIDVFVNSTGVNIPQIAEEVTEENWDTMLDTNLKGAFFCCQAVGRVMIRQKRGKIVNVSSQAGSVGLILRSGYCASKGGLNQMTRVLAIEWAKHNINVNCLSPTFVLTPMTEPMLKDEAFKGYVDANILLGRLATMDDLLGAAVFLASRASDMVTGQVLLVDGGWTCH